ncbi:hypothetical protein EXN00_16590 [Clostridium botulinum]|uniref:Uncharacterized protein n=1 Tax=Clostridium botulinum (strain Kyoto / Type A2) TaxID=536232 RepID=C1FM84_CLOBJ|nr:hypothetical protein [Clostridium botulinum]ACO85593.1 hypothetical protein CLM_1628 [Clostridium botulinum A2 str. Kyoto]AUN06620.1 hypothetical protein RSJ14_07835 [Clostridium botulinum]AUN10396.1 hypothetical protein RSJ6_07720 [Clostridium botulinum]MBN3365652.1 hypothetical protein [Clostridium botulinum]MBN3376449.1 hypothetical protein [Clostridium botulinum]
MSQKKIFELNILNTMDITTIKECEGMKKGIHSKEQVHHLKFYKNGRTITAVMTDKTGMIKGVGVAKCNPKDTFDIKTGLVLAEMRAREDFYKSTANRFLWEEF